MANAATGTAMAFRAAWGLGVSGRAGVCNLGRAGPGRHRAWAGRGWGVRPGGRAHSPGRAWGLGPAPGTRRGPLPAPRQRLAPSASGPGHRAGRRAPAVGSGHRRAGPGANSRAGLAARVGRVTLGVSFRHRHRAWHRASGPPGLLRQLLPFSIAARASIPALLIRFGRWLFINFHFYYIGNCAIALC